MASRSTSTRRAGSGFSPRPGRQLARCPGCYKVDAGGRGGRGGRPTGWDTLGIKDIISTSEEQALGLPRAWCLTRPGVMATLSWVWGCEPPASVVMGRADDEWSRHGAPDPRRRSHPRNPPGMLWTLGRRVELRLRAARLPPAPCSARAGRRRYYGGSIRIVGLLRYHGLMRPRGHVPEVRPGTRWATRSTNGRSPRSARDCAPVLLGSWPATTGRRHRPQTCQSLTTWLACRASLAACASALTRSPRSRAAG